MLKPGSSLTKYKVVRPIGQGGMGAVYLAEDESGQRFAIKEMVVDIREPKERAKAVEQFANEAELLRRLDHHLLVKVYETFEIDNSHYMVMDYVEGTTLSQVLEDRAELPPIDEVLDWALQLCEVLGYLHTRDPIVIFRDLKPSNIMLDVEGKIRLIDFGIARAFVDESQTRTFIKGVGSKGFAPIEQYGAGGTDQRTDIYSLGATLFNVISGEKPPASVSILAGTDHLEPIRRLNPSVPRSLEQIILNLMALQKENRYSTIAEVQELLMKVVDTTEDHDMTDDLTGVLMEEDWEESEVEDEFLPRGVAQRRTENEYTYGGTTRLLKPSGPDPIRKYLLALCLTITIAGVTSLLTNSYVEPAPPVDKGKAVEKYIAKMSARAEKKKRQGPPSGWKLVGSSTLWQFLDDGTVPTSDWVEAEFDDESWGEGLPPFGYGDQKESTTVSFGDDAENKHVTTYFRKNFQLKDLTKFKDRMLRLKVKRDDGVVVYLNGKEILRSNLPDGVVDHQTYALYSVYGAYENIFYSYFIDSSLLKKGTNTLAAELHQRSASSTDLMLDLQLHSHRAKVQISKGASWKVLAKTVAPKGWTEIQFTDDDWLSEKAPLKTTKGEPPTLYARKVFQVSEKKITSLLLNIDPFPGVIVYLNGQEIHRQCLPLKEEIKPITLGLGPTTSEKPEMLWIDYSLLKEGENVLALEFHRSENEKFNSVELELLTTP